LISRLGQHTGQKLKTKRKAMTYNILKRRLGNTNPTKNNNNTNPTKNNNNKNSKEKQR
jgi:hypothetical protein